MLLKKKIILNSRDWKGNNNNNKHITGEVRRPLNDKVKRRRKKEKENEYRGRSVQIKKK